MTLVRSMVFVGLVGCTPLTLPNAKVPMGVTCESVAVAKDDLATLLMNAKPGSCVVLPAGTYPGNFVVPTDVSLVASEGDRVTVRGMDTQLPVLTIRGGRRTTLKGFKIDVASGPGIVIEPGPVNLVGVSVTGATQALTVSCGSDAGCDADENTIEDCELDHNGIGAVIRSSKVRFIGGRVSHSGGSRLSDGLGIVVTEGASVRIERTHIDSNSVAGVVIDGATTRAEFTDMTVEDNLGRGVWVQGTRGAQTVIASNLTLARNQMVGFGAIDSQGLVVRDSSISDTKTVMVPIDIQRSEPVGDGVAFLSGVSDVTLERLTLQNNTRAQVLVDSAGTGIRGSALTVMGGQFRAVIQRTASSVQLEGAVVDVPPTQLLVVDMPLALPR